jgi:hypothetical protein
VGAAAPVLAALDDEHRRPEHQRQERDVDVAARGEQQQREARGREERGGEAGPRTEQPRAEAEDRPRQRDQRQDRDEHERAVRARAEDAPSSAVTTSSSGCCVGAL